MHFISLIRHNLFCLLFSLVSISHQAPLLSIHSAGQISSTTIPSILNNVESAKTVSPVQVLSTCQPGQYFKHDCKLYISCVNGRWQRNFCPPDTYWNQIVKKCDAIHNVPECYQTYLEIKRNVKTLVQNRNKNQPMEENDDNYEQNNDKTSILSTPSATTMMKKSTMNNTYSSTTIDYKSIDTIHEYDNYNNEENDSDVSKQNEELVRGGEIYFRNIQTNRKSFGYEKPYFTPEDYDDDYDEETDEDNIEKSKNDLKKIDPLISNGKQMLEQNASKQAKRSSLDDSDKNDIIDQDRKYEFKTKPIKLLTTHYGKINEEDRKFSSTITYGKVCVVRGKTMECHNVETTTSTPIISPTSTTTIKPISPIQTIVPKKDDPIHQKSNLINLEQSAKNTNVCEDQNKMHSYSFKIEIKIDDRIVQRIEHFIKIIGYYITFQFWA